MRTTKKLLSVMCLALVLVFGVSIIMPFSASITTVEATTKVKLNRTKATLYVGDTLTLKMKGTKQKVKWSSNKKSIAKVSSKGKVTGKKAGKAVITAKVGKKKYKCNITVKKKQNDNSESQTTDVTTESQTIDVTNITLDKSTIQLYEGENVTLVATVIPENATNKTVLWYSSNLNVARVKNGVVTGVGSGSATITATAGNVSTTCLVMVIETYTEEEMTAAVWLDFLTKRLRNPDSLQVSDIVIWGEDDTSSASLEIVYSAQNAYGGTNKKSMIGSLYGKDSNDNGTTPYIILPNGKYSFPNRRNPKPNGIQLTSKDKRLDINKIKRIKDFSYQYNFNIDRNNLLGWYENNKLYNEILQ